MSLYNMLVLLRTYNNLYERYQEICGNYEEIKNDM